ncbi:MAG: helix-turn-helix transcriptional regulator [Candidatus Hodarchaeales archaeon]
MELSAQNKIIFLLLLFNIFITNLSNETAVVSSNDDKKIMIPSSLKSINNGLEIANIQINYTLKENNLLSSITITYLGTTQQSLAQEELNVAGSLRNLRVQDQKGLLFFSTNTTVMNQTTVQFLPRSLPRIGTEYKVFIYWNYPLSTTSLSQLNLTVEWGKQAGLCVIKALLSEGYNYHNSTNPHVQIRAINNNLELKWAELRKTAFLVILELDYTPHKPKSNTNIYSLLVIGFISLGIFLIVIVFLMIKLGWYTSLKENLVKFTIIKKSEDQSGHPQTVINHTKEEENLHFQEMEEAVLGKYRKLLKPKEYNVFESLIKTPFEHSQQELCDKTGISKATMSRILASLELKNLISRQSRGMSKLVKIKNSFIEKELDVVKYSSYINDISKL